MEKEFIEKAKNIGLPEDLIESGLEKLKYLKSLDIQTTVDFELKNLIELWEMRPVY